MRGSGANSLRFEIGESLIAENKKSSKQVLGRSMPGSNTSFNFSLHMLASALNSVLLSWLQHHNIMIDGNKLVEQHLLTCDIGDLPGCGFE